MNLKIYTLSIIVLSLLAGSSLADMGDVTASYNAAPPAFGADTTVPATVATRFVFGSVTLSPSAISAANISITICGDGPLQYFNIPQVSGSTITWAFSFVVRGNDCYRFNNNLNPSGTNHISVYSYVDVLNETFESQNHVNSTFESQSHANATWESQIHANATWCLRTNATCGGNFTGNFTVLGANGMIETSLDPYIPFILFFGLLLAFLHYRLWFNAVVVLMVFGNSILPTPVWSLNASFLLLAISIMLEALVRQTVEWWKVGRGAKSVQE